MLHGTNTVGVKLSLKKHTRKHKQVEHTQVTGTVNIEKFNRGFAEDAIKVPSNRPSDLIRTGDFLRGEAANQGPISRQTNENASRPPNDSVRIESEIVRGRTALRGSKRSATHTDAVSTNSTTSETPTTQTESLTRKVEPTPITEAKPSTSNPSPTALPSLSATEATAPIETPSTTPSTTAPIAATSISPSRAGGEEVSSVTFERESRNQIGRNQIGGNQVGLKRNRSESGGFNIKAAKAQKTAFESRKESTVEEEQEEEEEGEEEESSEEEEEEEDKESGDSGRQRRISLWHKKQLVMYKIKTEKVDLAPYGINGEQNGN